MTDGTRLDLADALGSPEAAVLADIRDIVTGQPGTVDSVEAPLRLVRTYLEAGVAPATRRAYRSDLHHFRSWGGTIPSSEDQVAAYLAEHAKVLSVATLQRRLAAISVAHDAQGFQNPVTTPIVRATMRGIRRTHGAAQRQAKPLLREDLFLVLTAMDDRTKDLRDRALLLIGFAGGLRRAELVAITCTDIERVQQGITLTIPRSKTDQDGVGRKIGVPFGRTIHCPVRALDVWVAAAQINDGPIFRPVDRHGRISLERKRHGDRTYQIARHPIAS